MAPPKFDFDFGDTAPPPKPEGWLRKSFRIMGQPIADSIPGAREALEKFAQPGLNDSVTAAQIKGFLSGAAGAVTPGHLATIATLPAMAAEAPAAGLLGRIMSYKVPGLSGAVGNTIKAASGINQMKQVAGSVPAAVNLASAVGSGMQGVESLGQTVKDAQDPNKSKLNVAVDALNTGLGALGTIAGVHGYNTTKKTASALGAVTKDAGAASKTLVAEQLEKVAADIDAHKPFSEKILKENYPELYEEVTKRPAGKPAKDIWGPKGKPAPLSLAEKAEALRKEREAEFLQTARNETAREKFAEKTATQESKNLNSRDKFVEKSSAQEAKNLNAADKFRDKDLARTQKDFTNAVNAKNTRMDKFEASNRKITVARAQADAEDAKRTADAIAQADAERQANAIEGLRGRLSHELEPSTIRETVSGPGEHGGTSRATFLRTEPPADTSVDVTDELGLGPSGGGKGPVTGKGFRKADDAQRAADAAGGAFTVGKNPNDNLHYLIPEGQQPPWLPTVGQSMRPWSGLTKKEQEGLKPLLQRAIDGGIKDKDQLEHLGDELANRLGMIKDGRDAAEDSKGTLDAAIDTIKKSGRPILDNGSEEIKNFRQFLKKNGVSDRGLFTRKNVGRPLDQAAEDVKNSLPGFKNNKETALLDHLQSLSRPQEATPVEELIAKHKGNWWQKPTAEVTDYTQGDVPTLDVEPPAPKVGDATPTPEETAPQLSEASEPADGGDISFNPAELEAQPPTSGMTKEDANAWADAGQDELNQAKIRRNAIPLKQTPAFEDQMAAAQTGKGNPAFRTSQEPPPVTAESVQAAKDAADAERAQLDAVTRKQNAPKVRKNFKAVPPPSPAEAPAVPEAPVAQPEMSVPEFAQNLSQEGQKPIAPLPEQTFNLTGEDAPRAPEPSLFDAPAESQAPAPQASAPLTPNPGETAIQFQRRAQIGFSEAKRQVEAAKANLNAPQKPEGAFDSLWSDLVDSGAAPRTMEEAAARHADLYGKPDPTSPQSATDIVNAASKAEAAKPENVAKVKGMKDSVKKMAEDAIARSKVDPRNAKWDAIEQQVTGGKPIGEAPQAPVEPEAPVQTGAAPIAPQAPTSEPARFFKSPLEAAGPHYGEVKEAAKMGEVPDEAARVAGRAASRLNREDIAAKAAAEKAAQIQATKAEIEDPATPPLHREMLKRWLSEQGATSIPLAFRMTGGMAGAATGYAMDPLGNRPASAVAGGAAGAFLPELSRSMNNAVIPALANLSGKAQPHIERGLDFMNKLHNSGLLGPGSVLKKAAGDIGGLSLAGMENPDRLPDIIRQFTSPEGRALISQNFREGFHGPDQEALSGLENYFQGNTPGLKGLPGKALSLSGKTMGGLTKATKGIMGEAGLTEPEQQYYTLTAYPEKLVTKKIYEMLRSSSHIGPNGEEIERGSKILSHLSPFARIGSNRLERGYEYSPFGVASLATAGGDTDKVKSIWTKALTGTAVAGSAYAMTPDNYVSNHPVKASYIASLGGPLGLPILAGMALKHTNKNTGPTQGWWDWTKNLGQASQIIGKDIPGLRLLEDVTSRSMPVGFLRNYFSGYTNALGLPAKAIDPEEPDVSSNKLSPSGQLFNRMLSNVPIVRGTLPRKQQSLTGTPKFDFQF